MLYTMGELVERSGASARTIREYIRRGLLERPQGEGPAARYTEKQLLQASVIARSAARGELLDDIHERIRGWTLQKLRAAATRMERDEADQEPHENSAPAAESSAALTTEIADLPPGVRYTFVPLVPGLVLLVSDDASPLARRLAGEIHDRYRTTR
jgi:DNA-binding transcriptional MerR regulator